MSPPTSSPAVAPTVASPAPSPSPRRPMTRPRAISALARRELGFFFNGPIGLIVIALFVVVAAAMLFVFDLPDTSQGFFAANQASLRGLFGPTTATGFGGIPLLFVFLIPAVTMRLISEEKRTGTLDLLVTWPVTDLQIVLGKYLAAAVFIALMLLATTPLVALVATLGDLDVGMAIGGYLGLFVLGLAYAALGLMVSAWTKNQVIAYLVAALLCAAFYFIDGMLGLVSLAARDLFAALSFKAHFQNIARGVLDLRDLLFYASAIALAVLVTTLSLQARNWNK